MKYLFCLVCLFTLPAVTQAAPKLLSYANYELIDVKVKYYSPALISVESRWQSGDNSLNQFRIRRVMNKHNLFKPQKPFLFIAPFNARLEHYRLSSTGSYQHSIEAQLALAGYDVWVVEDRIYSHNPQDCGLIYDCDVMSTWGLNLRQRDIEFARRFVQYATKVSDPVIGGLSGGGMAAMAAVNANPEHFRALFSTGGLYSEDASIQAYNQSTCNQFRDAVTDGDYYRDSLGGLDPYIKLAQNYPDAASPLDSSITNYQFIVDMLTSVGTMGFLSYTPFYRFAAPNDALDDYKYLNADLFFEDTNYYGKLVSHNHFADIYCAIAGDPTFTSNLAQFDGNALFLAGGVGLAPLVTDNIKLFPKAHVTIIADPIEGGEGDNFFVDFDFRKKVLDQPLLKWLDQQY